MKKILKKIANKYYVAMAKKGKKFQKIIARGKQEEIELLFETLPDNQKEEASKLLYTTWFNSDELRPMVLKYATDKEIKHLFETLPDNKKEELAELLYSMRGSDSALRPMLIDILFKYASKKIIQEAMRSIISFDIVIARGKKYVIYYIETNRFFSREKIEYIKNCADKDIISTYLNSSFFIDDEIAEIAISLKLYDALFKNSISDKIAERILTSGDKELIFAALPQLSSVGIDKVRRMKNKLNLTKEEMSNLDTLLYKKKKSEEGWKMVSGIFDAAR